MDAGGLFQHPARSLSDIAVRDQAGEVRQNGSTFRRMLKKARLLTAQPRRAKTRCSAGKAARELLLQRFTPHVSRICRTPLADFFSILLTTGW